MAPRFVTSLALAVCMTAGLSAALGQEADQKGFFAAQRKQYRESVQSYPLIKQHRIDEVFRLHMDGDSLAADTSLEPDREYQQRRAELEGLSEPAVILCWLISQDLGQIQFELNVDDYSDPMAFGRLHVMARPNNNETGKQLENIEIEKIWQTPSGFRRVFFTQVNDGARMVIFANDGGPDGFININLAEKDFSTLRRLHHAETERWLRPILRELHQESAFAADPAAAWQILLDDWPANDSLSATVSEKIRALDADNFHVRQKAANDLEKLGRDGAQALLKLDRSGLTSEQNLRIDEVIARFKPLTDAEAKRLAADPGFLLDCLYGDDAIVRKLALARLSRLTKRKIDFDLNAEEDKRVLAVNQLRDEILPREPGLKKP